MASRILSKHIITFLLLVLLCVVYYHGIVSRLPFGVHSWAQADRYSIALNYFDSGMNFFLPRTHSMFPKDRVVGVEFPVLGYLAAVFAKVFGGRETVAFFGRGVNIAIIVAGLFYLYLSAFKFTRNVVLSLFAAVFVFCSPVFVFYGGAFLPDPVAVAIFFIGQYYYFRYLDEDKVKTFGIAVVFMLLASLIKGTIVFYFAAVLCFEFLRVVRRRQFRKLSHLLVCGVLSIIAIVGWTMYSRYLNKKYESDVFLASIRPFSSVADLLYFLGLKGVGNKPTIRALLPEYLVLVQYPVLFLLLCCGVFVAIRQRRLFLLQYCACMFCAATAGFLLFGDQLFVHDYYLIAIFTPLLASCILLGVSQFSNIFQSGSKSRYVYMWLTTCIMLVFLYFSQRKIEQRYSSQYPAMNYFDLEGWMKNGSSFLARNGVSHSTPIAVLGTSSPNLPLVYFDRKGINIDNMVIASGSPKVVDTMMSRKVQYVVANEETAGQVSVANPGFWQAFIFIAKEDEMMLYRIR